MLVCALNFALAHNSCSPKSALSRRWQLSFSFGSNTRTQQLVPLLFWQQLSALWFLFRSLSLSSLCICLSVLQTAESQSTCARKQRTSDRTSALSQALLLLLLVLVCSVRLSLAWLPLRWRTLRHRQKTGGQQPSTFTHSLSGRSTRSSSLAQINASFLCLSPSFQLSVC